MQFLVAIYRSAYAQRHRSNVRQYLATLGGIVAIYSLLWVLRRAAGTVAPESLYLLLILAVSLRWGLRLGLFASFLSVLAEHLSPALALGTVWLRLPHAMTNFLVYVAVALAVGLLASFYRAERLHAQHAAEQERHAAEYQRRMVGFLAHDLQAPLTGARGYLELGRRYARQGERQAADAALATSLAQIDRLTAMITGLVEASRIEQAPLSVQRLALLPLLQSCLTAFASDPAHDVSLDSEGGQAPYVHADPAALSRIVDNLLSNAVKYSPGGGPITLTVSTARDDGAAVDVVVADRGIGIAPDEADNVFAPYYRGTNQPLAAGTGVGLYICRELAQKMGGTLSYEPRPGGGSLFRLRLVASAPQPVDAPPAPPAAAGRTLKAIATLPLAGTAMARQAPTEDG